MKRKHEKPREEFNSREFFWVLVVVILLGAGAVLVLSAFVPRGPPFHYVAHVVVGTVSSDGYVHGVQPNVTYDNWTYWFSVVNVSINWTLHPALYVYFTNHTDAASQAVCLTVAKGYLYRFCPVAGAGADSHLYVAWDGGSNVYLLTQAEWKAANPQSEPLPS